MSASLGSVRQWHWISAALCLAGMLLFAITGITLNHAADIPASLEVITVEARVPQPMLKQWLAQNPQPQRLSPPLRAWLANRHDISMGKDLEGEWDDPELYLSMAGPGQDAWLALDTQSGEFLYEKTDRGWVAYFNDLHKGRDSGAVWRWFIDIFAAACVVFCVTGLILLWRQSSNRLTTWPLTTLGMLIPLMIMLIFIH
ncbi:PepSY-associated TM helix domain-containing protein [Lacimicrobium alkaliphilum]|nr:PepSY-associated TM helix domain-containing protein [Lacimicrobium alkaliphilum]